VNIRYIDIPMPNTRMRYYPYNICKVETSIYFDTEEHRRSPVNISIIDAEVLPDFWVRGLWIESADSRVKH
jgi:hypothetical protein